MARLGSQKAQARGSQRLTRAEMYAYYIAIVTMPRLVFDRVAIEHARA